MSDEEFCAHIYDESTLRCPTGSSEVYTDDCAMCFSDKKAKAGLFTCLSCWRSYCATHLPRHQQREPSHVMFMRSRETKKEKDADPEAPNPILRDVNCTSCNRTVAVENSGPFIPPIVESLISKKSAAVQDALNQQHLMSLKMDCEHQAMLEKVGSCTSKSPESGCDVCSLTGNCWLCLTCGHVGCGREDTGGKGHARQHFQSTGHSVVVKLGTITPQLTADVWCYSCGDDIMDYCLKEHLLWYGIDPSVQEKTVKTLREMELDMNSKFDWNKITEEGKALTRVWGPGFTGMENLGNSCYLASVVQTLFASPPFAVRYHFSEFAVRHQVTCNNRPSELDCQACQIIKMAHGLLSGVFSQEPEETGDEIPGVAPRQFKKVWCKGHDQFSGGAQQDADEFVRYLLAQVNRLEKGNIEQDPSTAFEIEMESWRECSACKGRAYEREIMHTLPMTIPVVPPPIVIDEKTGKPVQMTPEEIEASRPKIGVYECLATMLEQNEHKRTCPRCQSEQVFTTGRGVSRFPPFLLVTAQRFCWDRTLLKTRKIDVTIEGIEGRNLDFGLIRAPVHPRDEFVFPREVQKSAPANSSSAPVDEVALMQLVSMDFPIPLSQMALRNTDNNVDRAIEWIFSHPDAVPTEDTPQTSTPATTVLPPLPTEVDTMPATYELYAMISHMGMNAQCGHYVAHIHKDDAGWVLFNDDKVAKSREPPFGMAYIYAFRRKM